MKQLILGLCMGFVAAVGMVGVANAMEPAMYADSSLGKVLVDSKGMTLYVFDKDQKGATKSSCTDKCIVNWPPFAAAADAKAEGDWTLVDVTDKDGKAEKMWAYDGKPLYFFIKDKKAGDVTGEGVGSVWHVVKQGS
jgi:predicted lipoprotein with Yx(FWY)xxD motif